MEKEGNGGNMGECWKMKCSLPKKRGHNNNVMIICVNQNTKPPCICLICFPFCFYLEENIFFRGNKMCSYVCD